MALAAVGVTEVAITDVEVPSANASDYINIVKACLAVSTCVGITVCLIFLLFYPSALPHHE
jgi:endo-1,4-beta-xylanase